MRRRVVYICSTRIRDGITLLEEPDEGFSNSTDQHPIRMRMSGDPKQRKAHDCSHCLKLLNALLDRCSRVSFVTQGVDRRRQRDVHAKVHIGEIASLPERHLGLGGLR